MSTPKKPPTGNPVGRPKTKNKPKNPVGRPKGEAGIMKAYRQRMLNSPKSRKVLDKIFDAALDDSHSNQAAAWKIVMDRVAPISGFDKDAGAAGRTSISVIIEQVGEVKVGETGVEVEDAIEASYEVVEAETDG